jgi:hypothetical protein
MVGATIDLEGVHDIYEPRNRLFRALQSVNDDLSMSNYPNIKFYGHLLKDDERISKMDLEYWIDYVYLFGVKELIPLYDKMDPVTYRNWDVYMLNWTLLLLIILFWKKVIGLLCGIFCKCCSCCKCSNCCDKGDVKVEID